MGTKFVHTLSFTLLSGLSYAQNSPKCEIKFGSKTVPDHCFRWKTGTGESSDVAAMEKIHEATFLLPNGKVFSLMAKHNYLSSYKGLIKSADFYANQVELTYSEAVNVMIQKWKDIQLYDALPVESLKAIDKMRSGHGELFYPGLKVDNVDIYSTVRTLTPSKERAKAAKIWHVRFGISLPMN